MTDVALVPISWVRAIAFAGALAIAGVFFLGRCSAPSPPVAVLEHAVDEAKDVRAAAIETVTVYVPRAAAAKARSDSADQLVDVVNDTLVSVRFTPSAAPTVAIVPPQVTRDLITLRRTVFDQAAAITKLQSALSADSIVIRRQDSLIAVLRPSRCGAKCGGAIVGAGAFLLLSIAR